MRYSKAVLLVCLGVFAASVSQAVQTTFWQVGNFDDLLQGKMQGVLLTKDGELKLAPETQTVFNPDQTLALSLASDKQHNLYIGTGHQGKVYRVGPDMKGSLFFTAEEPDVFAMAEGPDGALYVATSPEGKIYRVTSDGKSKVFFAPKTKYIWALTFDKQGRLYAGTGDRGLIFKIDPDGQGKVFFDSHQTHVMCLTEDSSGNLLAGSVPDGLIYRIPADGRAFVLYKADYPEIHDLAVDSRGQIFAAALGAAGGQPVPFQLSAPEAGAPGQGVTATVTVTAGAGDDSAESDKTPKPAQTPRQGASFNRPAAAPVSTMMPKAPTGRGALIRIQPDLTAETVWTSNKESIFGLAVHGSQVLFTTDEDGRIFSVDPNEDGQNLTLLTETHESLATRLLYRGDNLYVTTSNIAKLMRLGMGNSQEGNYESTVKDTKFVSKWGVLAWRATVPEGASLKFYARSGNSDRPDPTWSDWSGPYSDPEGSGIKCPAARYLQWKAVLQGSPAGSPVLDDVTVSYLNQNLPPAIQSLNVSSAGERTGPTGMSAASAAPMGTGATVTVTSGPTGMSAPAPPIFPSDQQAPTVLTWQAQDPNGDQLIYSLYVRATDEKEWHLLKDKMRQTVYILDANTLPDGKYLAKLVASDSESNPPSMAREDTLESAPFWIDNTPPQVRVLNQSVTLDTAEIHFQAADDTSPLRSAEVSQDGKEWRDISSDDGIIDSRSETFTLRVGNLGPGEHVIVLRAFDTAGNAGLGKALVRIPGSK
jgi:sugar lactone lactonase YvrE